MQGVVNKPGLSVGMLLETQYHYCTCLEFFVTGPSLFVYCIMLSLSVCEPPNFIFR